MEENQLVISFPIMRPFFFKLIYLVFHPSNINFEFGEKDGFDPVKDCYCQCKTGARIVGCCMYIASVLWYAEHGAI